MSIFRAKSQPDALTLLTRYCISPRKDSRINIVLEGIRVTLFHGYAGKELDGDSGKSKDDAFTELTSTVPLVDKVTCFVV